MQHVLKNHQKNSRKSNFFTVIPFSKNSNERISANETPLPFQNSLMTFEHTIGSAKGLFPVAPPLKSVKTCFHALS